MSTYAVQRCPKEFVRSTIERNHYLHRWPDARSLPFAYCLTVDGCRTAKDGRPFGIVVFKLLQHHKQKGLFGSEGLPTAWQVLDMARVWIHDELRECRWTGLDRRGRVVEQNLNIFSRMVALVLRCVQRDWLEHHPPVFPALPYHIELVLSYCDRQHHQGTGYKASGFEYWGETSDKSKDIYIRRLRPPRWKCAEPLPL